MRTCSFFSRLMRPPVLGVLGLLVLIPGWLGLTQAEVVTPQAVDSAYEWDLPAGFPLPYVPPDNPMSSSKVELGRHLFYDTRLSANNTQSCASCHQPALAFTDGRAQAVGSSGEVLPRSALSLTNAAYNLTYNWANPTLTRIEEQLVLPLFSEHPVEMGVSGHEAAILQRLAEDARYRTLFAQAFPEADEVFTFEHIIAALASFTRTLISGDSPYDAFLRGDRTAISEAAQRGLKLFFSETLKCHHCHGGFNLSLASRTAYWTIQQDIFFNTGLYNLPPDGRYPEANTGLYAFTGQEEDMGRFRPPTLRNIALTAPYMHDGSIATLEGVIRFYSEGGRDNPQQSDLISGFGLSAQDMSDLIAFLESLTDSAFIHDPRFGNPW